jgi:hypothetical protein
MSLIDIYLFYIINFTYIINYLILLHNIYPKTKYLFKIAVL